MLVQVCDRSLRHATDRIVYVRLFGEPRFFVWKQEWRGAKKMKTSGESGELLEYINHGRIRFSNWHRKLSIKHWADWYFNCFFGEDVLSLIHVTIEQTPDTREMQKLCTSRGHSMWVEPRGPLRSQNSFRSLVRLVPVSALWEVLALHHHQLRFRHHAR